VKNENRISTHFFKILLCYYALRLLQKIEAIKNRMKDALSLLYFFNDSFYIRLRCKVRKDDYYYPTTKHDWVT